MAKSNKVEVTYNGKKMSLRAYKKMRKAEKEIQKKIDAYKNFRKRKRA